MDVKEDLTDTDIEFNKLIMKHTDLLIPSVCSLIINYSMAHKEILTLGGVPYFLANIGINVVLNLLQHVFDNYSGNHEGFTNDTLEKIKSGLNLLKESKNEEIKTSH